MPNAPIGITTAIATRTPGTERSMRQRRAGSMAEWYVKVGENVGLALTRLAPLMGSLILVSLFYGEYYAIPGVLASIGVVFAVGWC